jgi:AcrR family transcriptional regulator
MNANAPDTTGKRELKKARNRSVILDAARAVFVELGYDAAGVRDIVARTDLAPGTFYNYFPDKRSVLIAVISDVSLEASRRARHARTQSGSLEELIYRGFRALFEFIASDRATFELMRRNMSTLRTLGLAETVFAVGLEELREDLEAAMINGTIPRISLRYLPVSVMAMALEIGAQMVVSDPPDVEGATEFAAEFCIGGFERLSRTSQGVRTLRKTKRRIRTAP